MNRVSIRFLAAMILPLVFTIWLILPDELFIISLAKAFLFQALTALPILALIFLLFKWKGLAAGCFLSSLILLQFMIPFVSNDQTDFSPKDSLKVAQFNLKRNNQSYEKVVEMIKDNEAQLVSVQELDSQWMRRLEAGLRKEYPWSYGLPDESGFYGVAVFSKRPATFKKSEMVGLENIEGTIELPTGEVHFLSSHLHVPTTPLNYKLRNQHLRMIATWAKEKQGPVVTFGDYNTVSWDSNLKSLETEANLSRASGGWIPTYPANIFPLIPIDQIYYSEGFACASMKGLSIPGSDHRGVMATLAIKSHRTQSAEQSR
ncbi:endonuclease/exonuclease/phosphatase family protein [Halocola ammonii]